MSRRRETRSTLTALIARRLLDAQLAGLLWLLVEGGIAWLVSGRAGAAPGELVQALERLTVASAADGGRDRRPAWLLQEESVEAVFAHFSGPPFNWSEDQLRNLGLVLLVRDVAGLGPRLASTHYLRPVERDAAGHLQRRPPALLAALDAEADRQEHFAWAISAELADRLGLGLAEFERELERRRALLAELVAANRLEEAALELVAGELRPHRPD